MTDLKEDGRVPDGTGLSSTTEPASSLGPTGFDPSRMSKDERSFLLYAESCCVDGGGMLVGARMNSDDHDAASLFCERGLMFFGRIPSALLQAGFAKPTHYCELTLAGWELAAQLRRMRAEQKGPYARSVWEHDLTVSRLASDSDTRRMAETGTGSVRSTSSAGRQASPTPSQDQSHDG